MAPLPPLLAYPLNKKERKKEQEVEFIRIIPKWSWLSCECYMGRGLGVGGAPGSVGILQTCVRQAKNLPVVLKMILLKVQVKKITSKKRVKSICPRCLMSPLALICRHGARPRDSDNILTDGASLELCGKLEVWGL